jgi:general secretion pathway protein G
MRHNKSSSGFTFIELMVTLAILGVLASASYPLAKLATQRNKEHELKSSLRQIRIAIDTYKQAADEGQISKSTTESGYPSTLESLVNGVENVRDPAHKKIYFLSRLPRDPFADSSLRPSDTWGKRSYSSPPEQPEEGGDVFDVYSKAVGMSINGIPYREW